MSIVGKLFDWKTGNHIRCFGCGSKVKESDGTNELRIEYATGVKTVRLCKSCADGFDDVAVGG